MVTQILSVVNALIRKNENIEKGQLEIIPVRYKEAMYEGVV